MSSSGTPSSLGGAANGDGSASTAQPPAEGRRGAKRELGGSGDGIMASGHKRSRAMEPSRSSSAGSSDEPSEPDR